MHIKLLTFNYPVQSIDTNELALQRSEFAHNLAEKKVSIYKLKLKGNLKNILDTIETII
jgi:hypothetical protein